jgi:hypothetical protein
MPFADAHTQPRDKLDTGTHPATRLAQPPNRPTAQPPRYPPKISIAITATRLGVHPTRTPTTSSAPTFASSSRVLRLCNAAVMHSLVPVRASGRRVWSRADGPQYGGEEVSV